MFCCQVLPGVNDLTLERIADRGPDYECSLEELDEDAPRRWGRMVQVSRDPLQIQLNRDPLPRQMLSHELQMWFKRWQNRSVAVVAQDCKRRETRINGS